MLSVDSIVLDKNIKHACVYLEPAAFRYNFRIVLWVFYAHLGLHKEFQTHYFVQIIWSFASPSEVLVLECVGAAGTVLQAVSMG